MRPNVALDFLSLEHFGHPVRITATAGLGRPDDFLPIHTGGGVCSTSFSAHAAGRSLPREPFPPLRESEPDPRL